MRPNRRFTGDGVREYLDPQTRDWVPGVTSILKMLPKSEGLTAWKRRNGNHKELTHKAAIQGSLMHYRIQSKISDEDLELPDAPFDVVDEQMLSNVELMEVMFSKLRFDWAYPRWIEYSVYRRQWPTYAGTLDTLCTMGPNGDTPSGLLLIDFKSSAEPYESHQYQAGGYYMALPEDKRPENAWIIYLSVNEKKNPLLEPKVTKMDRTDLENYGNKFLGLAARFHDERKEE